MRKMSVMVVLALCVWSTGLAQEEPIPPKRSRTIKVGLFGGFTPGLLFPDVKPINSFLTAGHAAPLSENGVFLYGGGGAAYIMLLPNVRVGGLGMSGSIKSSSLDGAGIRRDAELKAGFGGITVEYVIPIVERLDFAVGLMFGWGGIDVTVRQSNGVADTWLGEQTYLGTGLGSPPNNITRILTGSFVVYIPSACVEYALLNWLAIRAGASYVGMAAPSWKVDHNYDLLGVPSNVNGSGFMINAGILLGTF